ncbi:MAG: HEAT repeat domain-containing protein [Planctomycetia bacterium]|nr:HEAT repeat domain-containing protein [Planctomycetia bacterium]
MPHDLNEYVAYFLDRLEGPEAKNAFHALVEAPNEAVPLLVAAYDRETRSSMRAAVVEVLRQFRDPRTVPFFATALRDDSQEIWSEALDGLVTIGGSGALDALRCYRSSLSASSKKAEWIDEAIGQIEQETASRSSEN